MKVRTRVDEGTTVTVVASLTDALGAPINPVSATFAVYREAESEPVQEARAGSLVEGGLRGVIDAANVRAAAGAKFSVLRAEFSAQIANGHTVTGAHEIVVRALEHVV